METDRQIITAAQRERLNHGLWALSSWCVSRTMQEHNFETTLTMLEKKASELRGKCMKAGWEVLNLTVVPPVLIAMAVLGWHYMAKARTKTAAA